MDTYRLSFHYISDKITDAVGDDNCYFHFFDHIRYVNNHPDIKNLDPDHIDDLESKHQLGGPWDQCSHKWLKKQSKYGFHAGKWIKSLTDNNDSILYRHRWTNLFFEHSWEPVFYDFDDEFWEGIKTYFKTNQTKTVLHSEANSKDIDKLHRNGYNTVHWFSHAWLCSEHYFKPYRNLRIVYDYKARPIKYKWLCANRLIDGPRTYRLDLLELLNTNEGCYSLLDKDPYTGRSLEQIKPGYSVTPASFDDHSNSSAEICIHDLTPWNTSFLHIVNETIWQDKIHFTEKVFKPIVLHQPFVVLQAPGSLQYLKHYGFKTFDTWWDESYDQIKNPAQRMQAIADIVNKVGRMSLSELEQLRNEMSGVLEHNFRHFYENIPDIVISELETNLADLRF